MRNNYDFTLRYHPRKANVVADALSRKSLHLVFMMIKECELIEQLRDLNLSIELRSGSLRISEMRVCRALEERIKKFQDLDDFVKITKDRIDQKKTHDFTLFEGGILRFRVEFSSPLNLVFNKKFWKSPTKVNIHFILEPSNYIRT